MRACGNDARSETGPIVHQVAVNSLSLQSKAIAAARRLDALAVGVLALIAVDRARDVSRLRARLGRLHPFPIRRAAGVALRSGFADKRALSFVNLYMYGGGFDMIATLAAKILPFGLFETRRLVGAAVGLDRPVRRPGGWDGGSAARSPA